jgi:preprotein translocase SecE subunit
VAGPVAKTRAQRKAERRKREEREQREAARARTDDARAQQRTQVPESADVLEAELAEQGADLDALREQPAEDVAPPAPAPSRADVVLPATAEVVPEPQAEAPTRDRISRRAERRAERERRQRAKASEARRRPREEPVERQRGRIIGFLISCWAELKRVQWPDRETLIQASAVTVLFIAVAAAYLGALDAIFNQLVKLIL